MKVFIVESESMLRQALVDRVGQESDLAVVESTDSGSAALARIPVSSPDALTTSYELPDGDGVDLARQVHAQWPDVRIVMVTTFDNPDVVLAALDAGCSGFVSKTQTLDDVVAAIRAVSLGETYVSPASIAPGTSGTSRFPRGWRGSALTPREIEILRLFPEGLSDRAIAARLGLAERTVRNKVQSILVKLGSHSKTQALAEAIRRGVVILR